MSKYEARIESLRAEHERVDAKLEEYQKRPGHDPLIAKGLKQLKLQLKDDIARLEFLKDDEHLSDPSTPLEVLDGDDVSPTIELPIVGAKKAAA